MPEPRDAITALVHLYAERLDAGDLDGVANLFAAATFGTEDGPIRTGVAAVLAAFRRTVVFHDGSPRTKHLITNLAIDVDEDAGTASATSRFTVLQATPALPLQVILAGRYHDRFRRVRDAWRFTARRVHLDLAGDLREHVRRP